LEYELEAYTDYLSYLLARPLKWATCRGWSTVEDTIPYPPVTDTLCAEATISRG